MDLNNKTIYLASADSNGLYLAILETEGKLELKRDLYLQYSELSLNTIESVPDKIDLSIDPDGKPILILFWRTKNYSELYIYPLLKLLDRELNICLRYFTNYLAHMKNYFLVESTCDIFVTFGQYYFSILRNNRASILDDRCTEINVHSNLRKYNLPNGCAQYSSLGEIDVIFVPEDLAEMFLNLPSHQTCIWVKNVNQIPKGIESTIECKEFPFSGKVKFVSKRDGLSFLVLFDDEIILFKVEGDDLENYARISLPKFNIKKPIYAFWTRDNKVFVATPSNVYEISVELTKGALNILRIFNEKLEKARKYAEEKPEELIDIVTVLDNLLAQMELIRIIQTLDVEELRKKRKELKKILDPIKSVKNLTSNELKYLPPNERKKVEEILNTPKGLLTILTENPDKISNSAIKSMEFIVKVVIGSTNPLLFTAISALNSALWILISKLRKDKIEK